VVAVDGTKVSGNANRDRNVGYDEIASEIIAEGIATDAAEDEIYRGAHGDELPPSSRPRRVVGRGFSASWSGPAVEAGAGAEPQTHEFDVDQIV
jgi:hypothetical protein